MLQKVLLRTIIFGGKTPFLVTLLIRVFALMNKSQLVDGLKSELARQYDRAIAALSGSREAATGTDTRAENKYDTRGLEASYLAAGQAEQADEILRAISLLEMFEVREFDFDEMIETGALVEVEMDDEIFYYLLAPAGGGMVITSDTGEHVTVLGPGSPLSRNLIGKTAGSILTDPELIILDVF